MQQWFDVVHEKNVLAGYESELVIQLVPCHFLTSHQSYLEWLKYTTAKPLQCTELETVRKEMIGKRDKL